MAARKKASDNTVTIDKNRERAINEAIAAIKKTYGNETINIYGDSAENNADVIHESTGSLSFDYISGGGLARGRVHEFFGPEGSGKTSVALQAVGQIQKRGGVAAFIDVEHAIDPMQAKRLGVDMKSLIFSQPTTAEQALNIMDALVSSGVVDIVILDSVAALVPEDEYEGKMEDQHMALTARLLSKALRKLTVSASQTGTIVVFINQVRDKIGVMYGNPETTPGGRALKFAASIRLRVSRVGKPITSEKNKDVAIGQHVNLSCVKNKVGTPYLKAETDFYFIGGMDSAADILTYGRKHGVLRKEGKAYVTPDGEPIIYKGEEVTKLDTLSQALHDKSTGLVDVFYQPVLDAMKNYAMDSIFGNEDGNDDEEEEDIDTMMDALDGGTNTGETDTDGTDDDDFTE